LLKFHVGIRDADAEEGEAFAHPPLSHLCGLLPLVCGSPISYQENPRTKTSMAFARYWFLSLT